MRYIQQVFCSFIVILIINIIRDVKKPFINSFIIVIKKYIRSISLPPGSILFNNFNIILPPYRKICVSPFCFVLKLPHYKNYSIQLHIKNLTDLQSKFKEALLNTKSTKLLIIDLSARVNFF